MIKHKNKIKMQFNMKFNPKDQQRFIILKMERKDFFDNEVENSARLYTFTSKLAK